MSRIENTIRQLQELKQKIAQAQSQAGTLRARAEDLRNGRACIIDLRSGRWGVGTLPVRDEDHVVTDQRPGGTVFLGHHMRAAVRAAMDEHAAALEAEAHALEAQALALLAPVGEE